jgi:hypothetical protein
VITRAIAALVLAGLSGPAFAADRSYSITEFDKISVDGPYQISVETGKPPSARASGGQAALDLLLVEVRSQRLVIKTLKSGWGERNFLKQGPITITVTVPGLKRIDFSGTGSLSINRIRTARVFIGQSGSSQIKISQIDSDQIDLFATGDGLVTLSGKALTGRIDNSGAGRIAGAGLTVSDLDVRSSSAGETRIGAIRSAKVIGTSSGDVIIGGKPACTVTRLGAGEIICGGSPQ